MKENKNGYLQQGPVQFFSEYTKDPSIKSEKVKTIVIYREVLNFIFLRIWHYMYTERWVYKAPRIGSFYVAESVQSKGFFKDWALTKKLGKITCNYNYHTNGRKFFIRWSFIGCKLRHIRVYRYSPYRGSKEEFSGKRGLAHYIKQCSEDPNTPDFRGHII